MKKVTLLFITMVSACLLQACHGSKTDDGDDDTTTDVVDTTKNVSLIIGKDDIKFVTTIAYGCQAEITIGTLAKQKGLDKRVKNLGAMMVKDLTKGKARLIALAKAKKIALPDTLDAEDQRSIADLGKKTGKEFDHAYLDKIKVDYKKALALFQNTAKYGYDPQIKQFATRNILTIQRHLDLIDAVHESMR